MTRALSGEKEGEGIVSFPKKGYFKGIGHLRLSKKQHYVEGKKRGKKLANDEVLV